MSSSTWEIHPLTSDHYNSFSPAWSTDGKWIYFVSDRMLRTTVASPWGPRQPDPSFDWTNKIYELALQPDLRSPFARPDELHPDDKDGKGGKDAKDGHDAKGGKDGRDGNDARGGHGDKKPAKVDIDFDDSALAAARGPGPAAQLLLAPGHRQAPLLARRGGPAAAQGVARVRRHRPQVEDPAEIAKKGDNPYRVLGDVKGYEISLDRKKMLVHKDDDFYILDSGVTGKSLGDDKAMSDAKIDLSRWSIMVDPRAEFRQMLLDAWRLERDYFYDREMHGVDWPEDPGPLPAAGRPRLGPTRARRRHRADGERAGALHTFVIAGDARPPEDRVALGALGAVLRRDAKAGGSVVDHVYRHDPDQPNLAAPLLSPRLAGEGGGGRREHRRPALARRPRRAGAAARQGRAPGAAAREVRPGQRARRDCHAHHGARRGRVRYREWEYTRRLKVDADSKGQIGYVHLQAMGPTDIEQWAREFYPSFDRQGLIIDVRHNHGGNIDSWLLSKLMRKAWFYWQPRVGNPTWNMQYAFRGHMVVLCDQNTASDGEAFTEGFRRLGSARPSACARGAGRSGSASTTGWPTTGSPRRRRTASSQTESGSSKGTAWIPTS